MHGHVTAFDDRQDLRAEVAVRVRNDADTHCAV
jgi:hypothetical protein